MTRAALMLGAIGVVLLPMYISTQLIPEADREVQLIVGCLVSVPCCGIALAAFLRGTGPLSATMDADRSQWVFRIGSRTVLMVSASSLIATEIRGRITPGGFRGSGATYDIWAVMTDGRARIATSLTLRDARQAIQILPSGCPQVRIMEKLEAPIGGWHG